MPVAGKLGKRAAVRPHVLSDLSVYAKGKIPDPPASVDFYSKVANKWGMLGKDTLGDCTIAGAAHAVMAWNAEVKSTLPVPDQSAVMKQYEEITGGADTGCVEANVLTLWQQRGLWGDNQISAFAPVATGDLIAIHQAVAFYGGAYIGVTLPRSAMDQFNQNQPWTVVRRSP